MRYRLNLMKMRLLTLTCSLLGGCSNAPNQVQLILNGDDFFGRPWPDNNRSIGGRPDMEGFPKRGQLELIDTYMTGIEGLRGFGTNSPIYIPLASRPEQLPTPTETHTTDGPLWLIDIDPQSPERGALIPLSCTYQESETEWQRADLLAVQPIWGFPLRPRTTYAVILTNEIIAPVDDWDLSEETRRDLNATLLQRRVDPKRVAFAFTLTTQDPVGEMARFEERIVHDLHKPALDQRLPRFQNSTMMGAYEGTMWIPVWQHGEKPYFASGGAFHFDEANMPILFGWEKILFSLSIPHGDMPPDGWPVTIYGHGTGGNSRSFANSNKPLEPANVLAEAGIAGFGISLPLHGERATNIDPALASFNYLNPDSARAVFRQGALDQLYLAELLTARTHSFELPDGSITKLDSTKVAYMGHSHGGLIGAIAAPFFNNRVRAVFLSGAGGGLSTTIVTRDAGDFDIQGLLVSSLDFSSDDELNESHPVVGMVQTLAEVTDPINYAPYWSQREPFWNGAPMSVLMTEGLLDLVGERLDLGAHTHVLPLMMMPARMAPAWISR